MQRPHLGVWRHVSGHLLTSGYISGVLGAREVHKAGASVSPTGVVTPMAGEGIELITECVCVCRRGLGLLGNSYRRVFRNLVLFYLSIVQCCASSVLLQLLNQNVRFPDCWLITCHL